MKDLQAPNLANIKKSASKYARRLAPYKLIIALALVGLVYAVMLLRISSLSNAQPTDDDIASQTNPAISAHIDEKAIKQLQNLQDNSVNVQTLFEEQRDNPFQEAQPNN